MTPNDKVKSLERVLNLFAEVRSGEAGRALLMTPNIFLILTSYLIAKVVREPLILAGGGAEIKTYSSAIQVILLIGVVRLYSTLVARFSRRLLINSVTIFFVGCLLLFYFLIGFSSLSLGVVYYLWVGIFSLVIIAQFWSYANDVYSPEQGKRLFVLLAFGASTGGVVGPIIAGSLIGIVGVYNLLLVSAALLLASILLTNFIDRRAVSSSESGLSELSETASDDQPVVSRTGAMKIVFQNSYLLMIAFLILLSNWVNTTGEYILSKSVGKAAAEFAALPDAMAGAEEVYIGSFYSDFFTLVGFVGLLLQLFVVSRVIKYLGVRIGLMTLPIIALGGYLIVAVYPILGFIRWAKTAENATDYSLNNTVRHILFLPTTKEEKYKAKVAIDSFFVRAGDVLSAGLVFVGVEWLALSVPQFAMVNIGLVAVWITLAFKIGRRHQKLTTDMAQD